MTRYVIVGAGAAGIAAAETIREYDPAGDITLFSYEKEGYYSRPALAYYLNREINKNSLYPITKADLNKLNIKFEYKLITEIDPHNRMIIDSNNNQIPYDKLLLAMGAKAIRPEIEGRSLAGVSYLDSLSQTTQMIKHSKRGKKAVVIGGGITALEIVEGLHTRNMEVHYFLRGVRYWNRVLDPLESELVLKRLEDDGVIVHRNTELAKISGKNGKVKTAHLSNGKTIDTNLIAFAIGIRPRKELAESAGLSVQRGVKVNHFLETSHEAIYAAGDVAEVFDPETDSWLLDSLWPIARFQGTIAGKNMTGYKESCSRSSPINVTRLAGLTTTIIGQVGTPSSEDECQIVRGESESWQLMPDAVICQNNFDINRVRLMVGDKILLGAVLIGDQSLSRVLEDLMINKVAITPIRDQLVSPEVDLAPVLIKHWQGIIQHEN